MKNGFRFLYSTICVVMMLNQLQAEWTGNGGPFGRRFKYLTVYGSTLYAGTGNYMSNEAGVYSSIDNGVNWVRMNDGLGRTEISALQAWQGHIYAGTDNGVYEYNMIAKTWTLRGLTNSPNSLYMGVTGFAFSGATVFACGDSVYRSTNAGASWTTVSKGLPEGVNGICAVGTNIFAATYEGVFLSTNSGASWNATGRIGTEIHKFAASGTTIFAGSGDHAVYRSTDNGAHWTMIGMSQESIWDLVVCGNYLFAATNDGVFRTSVSDTVWTAVNTGLLTPESIIDAQTGVIALAGSGLTLYAWTLNGGVFSSTNNGDRWINTGLNSPVVKSFAVCDSNLFAGTRDGLFRSQNGGVNWSKSDVGLTYVVTSTGSPMQSVSALAVCGQNIIAGAVANGIFLSSNFGSTWSAVDSGLTVDRSFEVRDFAVASSTIFAATDRGVYRSVNRGNSWVEINNGITDRNLKSITVLGTELYAVTYTYTVFHSTDNGTTWLKVNSGLPSNYVSFIKYCGTDLFACVNFGLYRSSDNGLSWTSAYAGLENTYVLALIAFGQYLFAGTDHGVFYSSTNGANWINTGATIINPTTLAVSAGNLVAGTYGTGFWKRPISEIVTTVGRNTNGAPTKFGLDQNYPNPFNPSTTISFSIPSRSFISLKIFDVMGREVITLVSDQLSAGTYQHQWNASGMPSGVYFYRLHAGAYIETKRLILLR
jgi:hypothetical protein